MAWWWRPPLPFHKKQMWVFITISTKPNERFACILLSHWTTFRWFRLFSFHDFNWLPLLSYALLLTLNPHNIAVISRKSAVLWAFSIIDDEFCSIMYRNSVQSIIIFALDKVINIHIKDIKKQSQLISPQETLCRILLDFFWLN